MIDYKQVAVITEAEEIRNLLKKVVETRGLKLVSLSSDKDIYDEILDRQVGFIFFDMDYSQFDTLTFLLTIKKREELEGISIILLSKAGNIEEIARGFQLGASDYIEKPLNEVVVGYKIDNEFKLKENCREFTKLNEQLSEDKEQIKKERDILSKYFSQDLIDALSSGTINTDVGGSIKIATILFCDVRNSTRIAEQLDPSSFMSLVNNLFTDLTDIIYGEGGSVNKFVGDGILATFGCPNDLEEDALHCARVALKIRKYLENFNEFRPNYIEEPINMGMGISRGQIFAGNVGSVYQIQYTVLGDPVNLASRLESLTKIAGVDILMDGNTRDALGSKAKVRQAKVSHVRGKLDKVRVYSLDSLLS